jgi:hypothetical protein
MEWHLPQPFCEKTSKPANILQSGANGWDDGAGAGACADAGTADRQTASATTTLHAPRISRLMRSVRKCDEVRCTRRARKRITATL